MAYLPKAIERSDRYKLPRADYSAYQRDGLLVVRGLVPESEIAGTREHADDILHGRVELAGVTPPKSTSHDDMISFTRVHMLHRLDRRSEEMLLQRHVLDVLETLIGPDVLALQTMLFYNPPGLGGQGWHQDSFYITVYPDTLVGVWLALERADIANGCLRVLPGSHVEPIYPPPAPERYVHTLGAFADVPEVNNVSDVDDEVNDLAPVAAAYGTPVAVEVKPGDAVFFHGHLLHRSTENRTSDRWRRAFVSHYCNARSWVPWNHGYPYDGDSANYQHILARGSTHLPHAKPKFGTEVFLPRKAE